MLTFLALTGAKYHDLQRKAAELRQLRAARTGYGATSASLKTLPRAKDNGTPQPC